MKYVIEPWQIAIACNMALFTFISATEKNIPKTYQNQMSRTDQNSYVDIGTLDHN